jgi:hypothetical protein
MIIKLPICQDNKIIFSNFFVEKRNNPDKYIISLFNRNYENKILKIKVPLCNSFEGISYLDLFFPLELNINKKKLYFQHFMQKIFLSQSDLPIDFFIQLENSIKKIDDHTFLNFVDLKTYEKEIWKYLETFNDNILTINYLETIKQLWEVSNLYLNYGIYLIYTHHEFTNKSIKTYQKQFNIQKKLITVSNFIKTVKYSINSSNLYNYNEHYSKLNNNKAQIIELKIGYKYFLKVPFSETSNLQSNKFFQIDILNISNGIIHTSNNKAYIFNNYEWYFYLPNLEINFDIIIFNLIKSKEVYEEIFEKTNLKIEKIHTNKILEYYYDDNECSLIYMRKFFENEFDDLTILSRNNYSITFFDYIIQKYSTNIEDITKIYKILFDNYSYPIKQNKLTSSFDFILYFSLINLDYIIKDITADKIFIENNINELIPFKVKTLFYNLIQFFYSIIKKNNYQILYFNQKFFNDYLHRCVLKNILFSDKNSKSHLINLLFLSKINPIQKEKIINILKNTLLCIDVANRLTWNNLPKKLGYLEIFYNNKDLLITVDKLNKNIFNDTLDTKLKKVIENPFEMFKYLKKEKDYIKWIKFLGPLNLELFYTPISLSTYELKHLGILLYLLNNIEEQNIKESSYITFINYAQKHNKLILDNNRINLKIKEYFNYIKCAINLGFLAKHLTFNFNDIKLDDDSEKNIELSKTQDYLKLKEEIKKITKKYNKYKSKYIMIKNSEQSIEILSDTSIIKNILK